MGTIPQLTDGKQAIQIDTAPSGTNMYVAGNGDDATSGVGEGPMFTLERATSGTQELDFYFNDIIYIKGAIVCIGESVIGDYMSFLVYAPASTVTANGGGTGNCDVIAEYGNLIVPAAGDGDYDIDLSAESTEPIIVPATSIGSGYWDWNKPNTGRGQVSAAVKSNGDPNGNYHLFSVDVNLQRYLSKKVALPKLSGKSIVINYVFEGTVPSEAPPHWKYKASLYNCNGSHTVDAAWQLITYRYNSV